MRLTRVLTIIFLVTISGVIINSCCEGFNYEWTYILTDNLNEGLKTDSDSIPKENFGIRVNMFHIKYACNIQSALINQALAYDCWEIYTKEDSIVGIGIVTMNRLNPERPAQSDVTDLFLGFSEYISYEESEPLSQIISKINREDMGIVDNLDLLLNSDQVIDTVHQFVIEISLSDNRILSDTTKPVRIY